MDMQWIFGGIEDGSRKCFMVALEKRGEATLLPIIKEWIEPGNGYSVRLLESVL